ncbi:MAG: hypothetical protein KDD62_09545, partial [Bdellovibrionales bacterium]|nr:hypothetical protein [Bdellovibrionales bacterium]
LGAWGYGRSQRPTPKAEKVDPATVDQRIEDFEERLLGLSSDWSKMKPILEENAQLRKENAALKEELGAFDAMAEAFAERAAKKAESN